MQYSKLTFEDQDYIQVGWLKDAHGIKGELFIHLMSGHADWLEGLKSFLLKSPSGDIKELKITRSRPHKKGLILLTPEITDRTTAEGLKRSEFLIPAELLESVPGEKIYLNEVLNFLMKDLNSGEEGQIIGFESNGLQDLLVIKNSNGQFLVPFIEEFINEIRFSEKEVLMDLPEGLLEL